MKKYPFYYYLMLFLVLVLSIIFWCLLLFKSNTYQNSRSPVIVIDSSVYEIKPVNKDKIIIDDESSRQIISNVINVAVKDTLPIIKNFIQDYNNVFSGEENKIVFVDSIINFVQIEVPENKRISFKSEIKERIKNYELLVWDESIFTSNSKPVSSNWYLDNTDLKDVSNDVEADDVTIAVIDNGFDLSHPSFSGKIHRQYNATNNSDDVSESNINHGSHVASVAAGKKIPNTPLQGVCQGCKIMPIKVEDDNNLISSTYVVKGILYAIKNQADVINLSLGSNIVNEQIPLELQQAFINQGAKDEETFWKELFDYAEKNNVLCVLAAGNSNILTGFDPFQRAENTIKVGAVDTKDNKADFSNYGNFTTIYAPGTQIPGAKPNNQYENLDGTSMAAPVVSGFVGLIKSKNKTSNNKEIIAILNKNKVNINDIEILKFKTLY